MTVFKDINNGEYVADTEIKLTEGVNGEKSLTGTIYFGNDVKKNLAKGWTMVFNDEEYAIVTFRYNDTNNTVSFSAVQMFFYTLSVKAFHEKWNGSHPLNEYLNAIFKDTGYSYNNETSTTAFEKENWGLKDKLSLFNDIINQISAEFEVQGTTVYIKDKIGSDLSTVVRQGFNLSTAEIETDSSSFATYGIGYGVHDDVDDQTSPRLSVEYYSPLYDMYKDKFGAIEAEPVDDERYTISDNLLAAVKKKVDNSWSLSITVSLLDLQNAGYPYAMASAGDSITIVDESLGFEDEVRIIKVVSSYNINGERISVDVTCGDLTMAQAQSASASVATSTITDIINGNSTLPDAWFSEQMQLATNSILSARTELKFTDQGIIAIDTTDHNKMVILNSAGIGVSTDGGQKFKTAITAESIDGQNINIKNLNASNIVAGVIQGRNLNINLNSGEVKFQHGKINDTSGRFAIDVDTGSITSTGEGGYNSMTLDDGSFRYKRKSTDTELTGEIGLQWSNGLLGLDPAIMIQGNKSVHIVTPGKHVNNTNPGQYPEFILNSDGGARIYGGEASHYESEAGIGTIYLSSNIGVTKENVDITSYDTGSYNGEIRLWGRSTNPKDGSYSGLSVSHDDGVNVSSKMVVNKDFSVFGKKNAIRVTRDGTRTISSYETAEPYFGDIGETVTGTDCRITVPIETLFSDMVNTNYKYQVFLQSYSAAHVWVAERHDEYFIIESDQPNASVAWEIKVRQRGYERDRLEKDDLFDNQKLQEIKDPRVAKGAIDMYHAEAIKENKLYDLKNRGELNNGD